MQNQFISPMSQATPWEQPQQPDRSAAYDQYTPQSYTPELTDPADYWNSANSGYDQMPTYNSNNAVPYDVVDNYQPGPLNMENSDWGNAYNYAPWSGANSPGGYDITQGELEQQPGYSEYGPNAGGFGGMAGNAYGGYLAGNFGAGLAGMSSGAVLGPVGAVGGALYSYLRNKNLRAKDPTRQFNAPAYQGHMFTPQEGFPDYYGPSPEGQSANQTQQGFYSQQPEMQQPQMPQQQQPSYDYNYGGGGQQNFVGQQDQNYGSSYNNGSENPLYNTFMV